MAKQQGRKPAKRPAGKPKLDDELIELASMLDERRLDKNAEGWFSIPWRDGWCAAGLAMRAFLEHTKGRRLDAALVKLVDEAQGWIQKREPSGELYYAINDALSKPFYPNDGVGTLDTAVDLSTGAPYLRACLRCIQMLIAKSDAGGMGYNAQLRPLFDGQIPEAFEQIIEMYRCADVLGPRPLITMPESVLAQRAARERAFQIAWRRGLYRAAYAL